MSALCSSIWSAAVRNVVDTATERRLSVCLYQDVLYRKDCLYWDVVRIRTFYMETTVSGRCIEKWLSVSGRFT